MAVRQTHSGRTIPDTTANADIGAPPAGSKQRAKAPSPWSVRGVSREARAKASKAASRRRETIGEWVTNALTQVANEELGTGPRWEQTQRAQSGLPAGPAQDETQLGKALLALAERFKRSEKRNAAIASLAERMESAEFGGQEVSVMAGRTGIVEPRSRALTLLVDRLESAERRENALLTLMHGVAERAERGEERIAAVTRGLADLALTLEAALNRNSTQTAQSISDSVTPLAIAVNALGNRLSSPQAAATAAGQIYGNPPSPGGAPGGPPAYGAVPESEPLSGADDADGGAQSGQQKSRRLKFDFHTLNEHAIRNSQRLAQDADAAAEDENGASGAWRGKQPESAKRDQTGAQASDSDDWAGEYMAQDAAHHTPAEGSHEPALDAASRAASDPKPAISEEDEMLIALKQAIKPKKP